MWVWVRQNLQKTHTCSVGVCGAKSYCAQSVRVCQSWLHTNTLLKSRLPFFRGRCPLHPCSCGGLFLLRRAFSLLRRAFYRFHWIYHRAPPPPHLFVEKGGLTPFSFRKKVEFTLHSYNGPCITTYQRCGFKKQKKYYCSPLPYPLQPLTIPGMHLIWYTLIANNSNSNHQFLAISSHFYQKAATPIPLMNLEYPRYGFKSIILAQ